MGKLSTHTHECPRRGAKWGLCAFLVSLIFGNENRWSRTGLSPRFIVSLNLRF
jgi:hypothetical protein